jgi:hypothetical protein
MTDQDEAPAEKEAGLVSLTNVAYLVEKKSMSGACAILWRLKRLIHICVT